MPRWRHCFRESQVRNKLAAGGTWIRTFGPSDRCLGRNTHEVPKDKAIRLKVATTSCGAGSSNPISLQRRVRCEPFSPAGEPNGIQSLSAAISSLCGLRPSSFPIQRRHLLPRSACFSNPNKDGGRLLDARALVSDRRASGRASWDPVFGCLQHLSLEPVAMIAQSGNSRAVT